MRKLIFALCFMATALFPSTSEAASEAEELMAAFLNLHKLLCAEVVNVAPLKQTNVYEVRCIEYRGGTGTVDYIVNLNDNSAFKR